MSVVQFSNGHGGVNCDHSPIDAMVTVAMSYFIHLGVTDMKGKWTGTREIRSTINSLPEGSCGKHGSFMTNRSWV